MNPWHEPWMADAACRGATRFFFADRYDSQSVGNARRICRTCPVRDDCHQYALDNPITTRFGVWAGYTCRQLEAQRRAMKAAS